MTYSYRLYNSIDEVPRDDWNRLREGEADLFMDPRFVAAVEHGLADQGKFWCFLAYDEAGEPVASACLSLYRLDGALFCRGMVKWGVDCIRRVFPRYLWLRVLFCGLPVSGGQSHLRFAPGTDRRQVLGLLDEALRQTAARERCIIIVFKEFDQDELPTADLLVELGYLREHSLPMNCFEPRFCDFDEFSAALRSHYRYKIRRSQKKFAKAGYRVEHVQGEEILPLYTDEVHRLYEAVVHHAETKLEILPAEFFRQLVRRFPQEISFLAIIKDDQIVAFSWGLLSGRVYRNLFVGVDYQRNAEADLYFNLMIHDLDYALKQNVTEISVGQTADVFKSRLGCHTAPRYLCIKVTVRFVFWAIRAVARWAFPPPSPSPPRDLFRDSPPAPHNAS